MPSECPVHSFHSHEHSTSSFVYQRNAQNNAHYLVIAVNMYDLQLVLVLKPINWHIPRLSMAFDLSRDCLCWYWIFVLSLIVFIFRLQNIIVLLNSCSRILITAYITGILIGDGMLLSFRISCFFKNRVLAGKIKDARSYIFEMLDSFENRCFCPLGWNSLS